VRRSAARAAPVLHGDPDCTRQLFGCGFDHWQFWTATGVAPDHLRFCLERRDKALHCHELGVTHFIDDRLDVLEHLRGSVPGLYRFGHQKAPAPGWVTPVVTWLAVLAAMLPELGDSAAALHR